MKAFTKETAMAAVIPGENVDTDQIIPARFLKMDRAQGYGQFMFHDQRFDKDGKEIADFVLNREPFRHAKILVTDENFGCGSSREGAVYAMVDYGIRAVIGPSFGDIFYNNALKNGMIPVRLPAGQVDVLRCQIENGPVRDITIDLENSRVDLPDGTQAPIEIDPFWRECLLRGVDEIELTMGYLPQIEAFEKDYLSQMRWITTQA
ncbi:3-isopropylmalate dehydratase small subunit [Limoniibacter endophyticus]|uniref:3-isopropylmalate dehydratase small subunit n=1 Tax=Limoniibacter endophyticus TaxID=1565040 RepID=A0A8J3DKZ8_9HYPH|nr:3-isopropylmalate dehydratase small subunit [Limoniibacter endophyticus]GHC66298.1 3-isopropylmalate dehydratase small subunit [Limoniibacter endophyticus]